MKNQDSILEKIKQLLETNIHESKSGKTIHDVERLITQSRHLLLHLYFVNDVLFRMDVQTDTTIDDFNIAAQRLGQLYRLYFKKQATPKIHTLETHCVQKLRAYGRVGPDREDICEREHQVQAAERSKVVNLMNKKQQVEVIDLRRNSLQHPGIAAAANIIESTKKRPLLQSTADKKRAKHFTKEEIKNELLYKWKTIVVAGLTI